MSSITDLLVTQPGDTVASGGMGGFVLGTVSENNSKDFPGMVRVEFTAWEQGKMISEWLPVLSSYAGKGYGQYLIPEMGDIVLVGFIGPMMEQPFVMGSFFPAGASLPGDQFSDKNLNRHIKTKGGVKLTLKDEDGKQSVDIETPKGLRFLIDDDKEAVSITDKDSKNLIQIDAKGGELSLTGDKKISLKAGKCEVTLDGSSGTISLKCDHLKIEAGQTAKIKSANMMTLEGGMVTAEGKQTLTLKGGAMCEVSGGIVKIN